MLEDRYKQALEFLDYNPQTGVFKWNLNRSRARLGNVAGTYNKDGYIMIKFNKQIVAAARLAFYAIHGRLPEIEIDHINRIKHDNRIINLRECTKTENRRNRATPKNNTSGYKGVTWSKQDKRWIAQTKVNHKRIRIGSSECPKLAHQMYIDYINAHYKEFACHE